MKKKMAFVLVSLVCVFLSGCFETEERALSSEEIGGLDARVISDAPLVNILLTGEILPSGVGVKSVVASEDGGRLNVSVVVSKESKETRLDFKTFVPVHVKEMTVGSDRKTVWKRNAAGS